MDYEKIEEKETGEEIKIKISKEAFKAKKLYCDECDLAMKTVKIDIDTPNIPLTIHLEAFKCPKCGKEYLNSKQAKKMDKALMIGKIISEKDLVYERAINYDKSNYFVRFPALFTKGFTKHSKAEIKPLSSTDFLIHIKKEK